jgi:hypothetical protein
MIGSGIRKKHIPDPISWGKKAPGPGSGFTTLLYTVRKKEKKIC